MSKRKTLFEQTNHSVAKNIFNAILCIAVAIPSIYFTHYLFHNCRIDHSQKLDIPHEVSIDQIKSSFQSLLPLSQWSQQQPWCDVAIYQPILFVNIVFFLNVCILFWVISLLQNSTWLIDPYWTIIPVMNTHYYFHHPLAQAPSVRSVLTVALMWIWSFRLTHSYFRREEWNFGAREDWRFTKMKQDYPKIWWWLQFFACYLSQQLFLIGIALPMYPICADPLASTSPLQFFDYAGVALSLFGIIYAAFADTQLRAFMINNEDRKAKGEKPILIMEQGVWRYSRHPNYVGEQCWWWGLALMAHGLGYTWMISGAFVNSLCLAAVTVMVEQRMLAQSHRIAAFRQYQKTTSVWIPWFKFSSKSS